MTTLCTNCGFAVAVLYGLVSLGYAAIFRSVDPVKRKFVRIGAMTAVTAHFLYLILLIFKLNRLPLASMFESLTVMSFIIGLTYIFIQFTSNESGTGIFVFPVICAAQFAGALNNTSAQSVLASPFFAAHILPSISGYAAFMISMLYSLMFILMHMQIKTRKFGLIFNRLPSLKALDNLNRRAVYTGFALLTFGLIIGIFWAVNVWESISPGNPKLLISYICG
ncbi:inner membrane protein YpjD [candidate division KSB1 bacterium]